MQPDYETSMADGLAGSYGLLWRWDGFDQGFRGPRKVGDSGAGLLAADLPSLRQEFSEFWLNHPRAGLGAEPTADYFAYYKGNWRAIIGALPSNLRHHAAYLDGRVTPYEQGQARVVKLDTSLPRYFYLPPQWE